MTDPPDRTGPHGRQDMPTEIGGYRVHRVLGTGGMATVYAALQKQPRRMVALKVLSGVPSTAAAHRFKREIEILGRLRHPSIAQVYDAGVHDGPDGQRVPYFVMEYVPGARTILDFAEDRRLATRDRLKLFVKVCAAVDHGHRNKIIHRDLKPGNVLIDETGTPKIIDFGIARATEIDVTSQTMEIEAGHLVGTLQAMAPEQLSPEPEDLDARCDVYALGVLLYRLLTGRPPHDVIGLPVFTAARIIREDQPPRPSSIRPDLAGDLEQIILRALAKDRRRRYPKAGSLGRDVMRFLLDRPVQAGSARPVHRLRLWTRRHRSETRAVVSVCVVLLVSVVIVAWARFVRTDPSVPAGGPGAEPAAGPADPPLTVPAATAANGRAATPEATPSAFILVHESSAPTSLAFDPSGEILVSATEEGGIVWWDTAAHRPLLTTADHDAPVRGLAFSADGTRLASADATGGVVVVERDGAGTTIRTSLSLAPVLALALSPGGDRIAVGLDDLTVRIYDTRTGTERLVLSGSRGAYHAAAFGPDGSRLAAGSDRGDVYVWSMDSGDRVDRLTGLEERVMAVAFDPEGRRVAAVSADGSGRVWTLGGDSGRGAPLATGGGAVIAAAFDSTHRWLAAATEDEVSIIDIADGRPIGPGFMPAGGRPTGALALSPDGRWCAVVGADRIVRVAPVAGRW